MHQVRVSNRHCRASPERRRLPHRTSSRAIRCFPTSSSARSLSFFRVKDEAATIALANDSDFGLGMMFINNIDWTDAELPFGGIKYSGYGRELGNMGIQEFVNKKPVRTAKLDAPA